MKILVKKRTGDIVPFDKQKITNAVNKAFIDVDGKDNIGAARRVARQITADVEKRKAAGISGDVTITVEDIQDLVEQRLMASKRKDVAKAYILYRKNREKLRGVKSSLLDYKKLVDDYVKVNDWRVKENSTVTYSVGGLILSNSGAITANYWLNEIYDDEIANAHKNADLHIHDLSMLTGYCFTGDTRIITPDGVNPTFEALVSANVRELPVFAYDTKERKIVTARAINPRITRKTDALVAVTLSSGTEIRCTPNHLFMLRDGTYCEAQSLQVNDSLMPLHRGSETAYVKGVEEITLKAPVYVYDLTVPGYENFLIDGKVFVHNCAGWSLRQLIEEGLGGIPGKVTSAPAKHLSTLCNQMVNFLGIMQNEWAGAQAFSSFDTYLAPFVKADNLSYEETKQCIESFIYGVNTPSRWGTQAPFSNITLDWTCPEDLAFLPAIVAGKPQDFTYGDCKKEMDMVNKAFIEIMIEGDANGRGFQYPIPTYSITKDFDWSETENNKLLFEMTSKYGTPYFSNYVNSDMEPNDVRSMCPLRGDQRVLIRDDYSKEWHISTIENLYKGNKADKTYDVMFNGKPHKASLHRFDGLSFYRIKTTNGHEMVVSANHMNRILRQSENGNKILDVQTTQMKTGDYLPFNTVPYNGKGLSYEDGLFVGAFLGDGCLKDDYTVTYSLNNDTKKEIKDVIVNTSVQRYGAKVSTCNANSSGTCVNVSVTSKMLRGLIEDYVSGTGRDKRLSIKAISRSLEFREGILEGLVKTDGTESKNRIYTSSKSAVEDVCAVLTSIGLCTKVTVDERTVDSGCLSDNPIYCIRYYDPGSACKKYKNIYIREEGMMWISVAEIEQIEGGSATGYCFEVLKGEPLFILPSGIITHNCRLRLDLRELRKKSGGFFGSGESTGSIGVVTINMPRIAYLSNDEAEFYNRLDRLMDIAARSLDVKRGVITKLLDEGLYPYTKRYLETFANHFSTIGLVGMNEACLNAKWIQRDLSFEESQAFTKDVLNHMRERLSDYQEQYGDLFNLEATPAESTAYRLAMHDRKKYPHILTASGDCETPYYTNSSHLPVGFTDDVFSALDIQDELQTLYTSGTVFHAFLGEKLSDWRAAATLVRKIAENYRLPYYTLSPTYSVCREHGYISGEEYKCPKCGNNTEVYSRITGYYRPVQNWNDGKAQEFRDRKEYKT